MTNTNSITNKPRRKVRKIWKYLGLIIVLLVIANVIDDNLEVFSPGYRKCLIAAVNEGDPKAIEKFDEYLDRDIYLSNGPRARQAMANKHGLDYEQLTEDFENSGYNSLQEYYNDFVK